MPTTVNKSLSIQSAGSNNGVWGVGASTALNEGVIQPIDNMLGGIVVLSLSSSPVVLTGDQIQQSCIRLTGVLLTNIQITSANVGFYFVENLTTGAFQVTVTNGIAGVIVPQGGRVTLFADPTKGVRIMSSSGLPPTGTVQPFFNATAPTGWTKLTSLDNGTMRIVSGTGGGIGGTANFSDVFTGRFIAKANMPNYNLTVTDPGHDHNPITMSWSTSSSGGGIPGIQVTNRTGFRTDTETMVTAVTNITVNTGGSGTAFDFSVKYRDAILCQVN